MRRIVLLMAATAMAASCDHEVPVVTPDPTSEIWWNDRVFYEIFVRSFYDSNGDGIGDFQGLTQKLDYLNDGNPDTDTDLGITGIWLMPIYPSPSYHGYDITNYVDINPQYGTLADFSTFMAAAHDRGINVVIDFVANHTSDQHPWFINSSSSPTADKREYYVWTNAPQGNGWVQKNGAYYYAFFWSGMPDLNYRSKRVTNEMYAVADFWRDEMKVDGFRMDAAPYLIEDGTTITHTPGTLKWWRDFWIEQKSANPATMIVGEVWTSTNDIVPYTDKRMDYCFEFDLSGAIINAVVNGNVNGLKAKINQVVVAYPALQYGVFLSNHDQNRVIESLSGDLTKAKVAAAIMLTLPGVPYLYYGEEVAMRGAKPDEDIRKPMQWDATAKAGFTTGTPWREPNSDYVTANVAVMKEDESSLWNLYRTLIHARNGNLALRQGGYFPVDATSAQVFAFLRIKDAEAVMAVHNISANPETAILSATSSALTAGNYNVTDLLTGSAIGSLTAAANGKFENFSIGSAFEGRSVRLMKVVKQ
jgi:alpha-amylase